MREGQAKLSLEVEVPLKPSACDAPMLATLLLQTCQHQTYETDDNRGMPSTLRSWAFVTWALWVPKQVQTELARQLLLPRVLLPPKWAPASLHLVSAAVLQQCLPCAAAPLLE